MRAKHAREIRAGINAVRHMVTLGIPPRPQLPPTMQEPPTLYNRARQRTEARYYPSRARKQIPPPLPPVPGPHRKQ